MQRGDYMAKIPGKEPPYYEGVTLEQCAKNCVSYGPECVGIDYYTQSVDRYYSDTDGSIVRKHDQGDCLLASSTETAECNEHNRGNVEFYVREGVAPQQLVHESALKSSKAAKSPEDKDFTVRIGKRSRDGQVPRKVAFLYKEGQCMQGGEYMAEVSGKDPPYYEGLTLQQCAKKCIAYGPECLGIDYYTHFVDTYPRDDTVVRKHYKGDCILAGSLPIEECNEYNLGNVEFYARDEDDEETVVRQSALKWKV